MTDALFDMPTAAPEPVEKLSADRRRTIRQRQAIANGVHPLASPLGIHLLIHADETRTCGSCAFRHNGNPGNGRSYPKCLWRPGDTGGYPRVTGGAATDVRAWWPACRDHEAPA